MSNNENPEAVEFDKAFRIFKQENPKAKSWDSEAVYIFAKKRVPAKSATLSDWLEAIAQY